MRLLAFFFYLICCTPCMAWHYDYELPDPNHVLGDNSWADFPFSASIDVLTDCTFDFELGGSMSGAHGGMLGVTITTYPPEFKHWPQDGYGGFLRAYAEVPMNGTAFVDGAGNCALQWPLPNGCTIFSWDGEYDFGYTWFKQYHYFHNPQDLLDHSASITIAGRGCFLCCCCNSLNSILHDLQMCGTVTPPALNDWLKDHGGFTGHSVYGPKVAEYARRVLGVKVGFRRDVPLDEALARGYKVQCSVHHSGHWVSVPCLWLTNGSVTGVKHKILDPMYDSKASRRFRRLEKLHRRKHE